MKWTWFSYLIHRYHKRSGITTTTTTAKNRAKTNASLKWLVWVKHIFFSPTKNVFLLCAKWKWRSCLKPYMNCINANDVNRMVGNEWNATDSNSIIDKSGSIFCVCVFLLNSNWNSLELKWAEVNSSEHYYRICHLMLIIFMM